METLNQIVPDLFNDAIEPNKHKEQSTAVLVGRMAKHSVIIRKSTTFLIVFSILALYAAMYLIHMESIERQCRNATYKTAVR